MAKAADLGAVFPSFADPNLLCSAFFQKAEDKGVRLTVDTNLPRELSISDTEFCAILSNGLENALHAVSDLDASLKWTELYCAVRTNNLLIEIKNPYAGTITMQDGLPVSSREGHGYGCRSIRSIAEHNGGLCLFEAEHGVFTLRVVLPISQNHTRPPTLKKGSRGKIATASFFIYEIFLSNRLRGIGFAYRTVSISSSGTRTVPFPASSCFPKRQHLR